MTLKTSTTQVTLLGTRYASYVGLPSNTLDDLLLLQHLTCKMLSCNNAFFVIITSRKVLLVAIDSRVGKEKINGYWTKQNVKA